MSMRAQILCRPPEPALGTFGEKLRKQREQQGIALDAISDATKINTRMLRALEDEHFDQLPGGVFNKGFVRAYARHVGLDEEEAIADYLAALREIQIQGHSTLPDLHDPHGRPGSAEPSPQVLTDDRRKHGRRNEDRRNENLSATPRPATHVPTTDSRAGSFLEKYPAASSGQSADGDGPSIPIPWGKLAAALLLVTFALALWSHRHRQPAAQPQPATAALQSPAPAPVTAPRSAAIHSSNSAPSSGASQRSPSLGSPSLGSASNGSPSHPPASPASKTPPASPVSAPSLKTTSTPASPAESSTKPVAESTPPAAAANPLNTFTLLIRAEETTWVSITADGKPVAQETLIAPAHTSVRASGEVVVKAGNAAGVSFQLNGKEIPAQGNEGEVRTYIFDAAGFRILPSQSPTPDR
jgi:cytoskeletal protein RodZ